MITPIINDVVAPIVFKGKIKVEVLTDRQRLCSHYLVFRWGIQKRTVCPHCSVNWGSLLVARGFDWRNVITPTVNLPVGYVVRVST